MPNPTPIPAGSPCWIDLSSGDTAVSTAFYGELFGWTAEDGGEQYGGYITFHADGAPVAGCMAKQSPMQPEAWAVYLAVDDADATVAAATAAGATVMVPAMDVSDLGRMAFLFDPSGAVIGLWQPASHGGFGMIAEDGTPSWFELLSTDYAAAVPFYESVFGWDTTVQGDTPEFRYTTLGNGELGKAGVMDGSGFLPEGVPSHWSAYIQVADAAATAARAVELGGSVAQGPDDTPYGVLASIVDPNGAVIKLQQQPTT